MGASLPALGPFKYHQVFDGTTEAPIISSTAAFTTLPFTVDHTATIYARGLVADTIKVQFSVPDGNGDDVWEDLGIELEASTPARAQTSYGPGRYRLVRVGTADTLSVAIYTARRK